MRISTWITTAVLITLASTCFADPIDWETQPEERTATGALVRSLLHTALPIAGGLLVANHANGQAGGTIAGLSIAYGVLVGPSVGNFYLADYSGGTLGIVSRGAGGLMMVTGLAMALGCAFGGDEESGTRGCKDNEPAVLLLGGAGTALVGTLWNLGRQPGAAHRWQREAAADNKPAFRLAAAPTWSRQDKSLGLRLSLSI